MRALESRMPHPSFQVRVPWSRPLLLAKKDVHSYSHRLTAKLSLQHASLPELYMTAGACSHPAGLLAPSLAGSILLCLKVSTTGWEGIAPSPIYPRAIPCGLWEVQVSAHQVGSSPHPPDSSSAHNTALFLTHGPPGAICHLVSDSR